MVKQAINTRLDSFENIDKAPPQSLEAEKAVLGAMIMDEDAVPIVFDVLDVNCFYKDAHRKVFSCIAELFEQAKKVDLLTLSETLKQKKLFDEIGGAVYLASLTEDVPTSINVKHYAYIVREKNILRMLIQNATQIIFNVYHSQKDVDSLLDQAEQLIFDISHYRVDSDSISIRDIIKSSIETIDRLYQDKSHVTGVSTGFTEIDSKTAGLQKSDLIIVAGRPSMGKSAFVLSIAEHVALVEKKPVGIFSLEMSKEQVVQRMLCSHAQIDAHKVRTGFLAPRDWPLLTSAAGKLSEASIYIEDAPAMSLFEIRAKARRLKSRYGIELVIVDYMQLIRGEGRIENRQQEITLISQGLKALSKELNIPVIAVSQLSRAVENRAEHRPQLSDLRESGSIEQDADVVLLLLREEYYNPTPDNEGIAEAIIAKQRNGPVGSVSLAFIKRCMKFANLADSRRFRE